MAPLEITTPAANQKASGSGDALPEPREFADSIAADHKVLSEDDRSRELDQNALVIYDRFTRWLTGYPVKSKSGAETEFCFKRFFVFSVLSQHTLSRLVDFSHDSC